MAAAPVGSSSAGGPATEIGSGRPFQRAVTGRAVVLGLAIALFVNAGSPYAESVGFSNFSWSYVPEGAVIPFLALLAANALARRTGRGLTFVPSFPRSPEAHPLLGRL